MKASPISVNAAVNDAAAKTVTSPDTVVGPSVDDASVSKAVAVDSDSSDPHEAPRKPKRATAERRRRGDRRTGTE
jgi:hypothetical protein